MTRSVTATAPAKINLALTVGPVRDDGFHSLATVYQALSLEDEVRVTASEEMTLSVVGDGVDVSGVPTDATNLAWKAAALLAAHHGLDAAVDIQITKRIPVAGGLAGGSADAAAALVACDALWDLGTPRDELLSLAAQLGSDIPFSVMGGTALGVGRGEEVSPVEATELWWVVVPADGGLSTPEVFREYDRLVPQPPMPYVPPVLFEAVATGDAHGLALLLENDLQQAALSLRPDLKDTLRGGMEAGALRGIVSGSGPTTVFLVADEEAAGELAIKTGGLVACSVDHGAKVSA